MTTSQKWIPGLVLLTTACAHKQAVTATDPPFAVNVTASPYSAHCDGVTDDTDAFQGALNSFPDTGGRVQVPASGNPCKITATLNLPYNVILEGESSTASLIWLASSAAIPVIQLAYDGIGTKEVHGGLLHLGITGNGRGFAGQVGFKALKVNQLKLQDVRIINVDTGFLLDGGEAGSFIADTTIWAPDTTNVNYGLKITSSGGVVTDTRVYGGYLWGNSDSPRTGYGIYADAMHSSSFHGVSVESFGTCYYLTNGGAQTSENSQFHGTRAEHCGAADGMTSYVVDGSSRISFFGPYDADVANTLVQYVNGGTGTVYGL